MKDFASKIPSPISALALGWVILGNVFQGIIPFVSDLCMVISLILIVLTIVSMILNPKRLLDSMKTSLGLSLLSCLPMSLMMISVWMKGVFGESNIYFWIVGVIFHTAILIIFTLKHIYNFNIKKITPAWFLVYVGIGVGVITCEDFGMIIFGRATLRFIVVLSIILSIPILYSTIKNRKKTKNAFKPFFTLLSFPLGIIIPAYVFVEEVVSKDMVFILLIAVQVIFLVLILSIMYQVLNGFYPSWSCYTLSGAIILYASTVANDFLISKDSSYVFVRYVLDVEYVVIFVISAIILLAYLINVLDDPTTEGTHINISKRRFDGNIRDVELIDEKNDKKESTRFRRSKNKGSKIDSKKPTDNRLKSYSKDDKLETVEKQNIKADDVDEYVDLID